jgi:hypothetical protein
MSAQFSVVTKGTNRISGNESMSQNIQLTRVTGSLSTLRRAGFHQWCIASGWDSGICSPLVSATELGKRRKCQLEWDFSIRQKGRVTYPRLLSKLVAKPRWERRAPASDPLSSPAPWWIKKEVSDPGMAAYSCSLNTQETEGRRISS